MSKQSSQEKKNLYLERFPNQASKPELVKRYNFLGLAAFLIVRNVENLRKLRPEKNCRKSCKMGLFGL